MMMFFGATSSRSSGGDREERLEPPEDAVGAPVLGDFHRGAREVAPVLVEPALEAREERERVRRGAGEAGQDAVVVELPHLLGARLHDGVPDRDLAVTGDGHLVAVADGDDGRRLEGAGDHAEAPRARGWAAS